MQSFIIMGFLDSGKTTFINNVLADPKFPSQRTAVLQTEFGEEEVNPDAAAIFEAEDCDELAALLAKTEREGKYDTVIVEYNGMWKYDRLVEALPIGCEKPRRLMFADWRSIFLFNRNMRELLYDKFINCDLVVFNRCIETTDISALHSLARSISINCQIVFEYSNGRRIPDTIQDDLPYDLNADKIAVDDSDYAIWLRDLNEHPNLYAGKTFRVKCRRADGAGSALLGRHVMSCCAADIAFKGVKCIAGQEHIPDSQWFTVEATIELTPAPAFRCLSAFPSDAPSPEISKIDMYLK